MLYYFDSDGGAIFILEHSGSIPLTKWFQSQYEQRFGHLMEFPIYRLIPLGQFINGDHLIQFIGIFEPLKDQRGPRVDVLPQYEIIVVVIVIDNSLGLFDHESPYFVDKHW